MLYWKNDKSFNFEVNLAYITRDPKHYTTLLLLLL